MKYIYGLEPVSDENIFPYLSLYRNHYGQQVLNAEEVCLLLRRFYGLNLLSHFACAKLRSGHPVSAMGIVYSEEEDQFFLSHLVTHTNYRKEGLAKDVIMHGAKMLMAFNKKITNHKRTNVIPHEYFDKLGFTEEDFTIEDMPEYDKRYVWSPEKE